MATNEVSSRIAPGDRFPDIELETTTGPEAVGERLAHGPLVLAFERHFG